MNMYIHNDVGGNDVSHIGAMCTSGVFSLLFIPQTLYQIIDISSLWLGAVGFTIILPLF